MLLWHKAGSREAEKKYEGASVKCGVFTGNLDL
jgi:hypothetical protein